LRGEKRDWREEKRERGKRGRLIQREKLGKKTPRVVPKKWKKNRGRTEEEGTKVDHSTVVHNSKSKKEKKEEKAEKKGKRSKERISEEEKGGGNIRDSDF